MPRQVKDRKNKKDAEKLAREIRAQLKRGEIGQVYRASAEEQELFKICRKLGDPKRVLEEALERQEIFKRATVAECCDRYIDEYRDRDSGSYADIGIRPIRRATRPVSTVALWSKAVACMLPENPEKSTAKRNWSRK